MTVTSFEGKMPVIGDVRLGARCWIGPGGRLRGDYGSIVVGDCCAVEDNCVIHARPGETCTIGSWVTLGHGCVVHSVALLGDYAVVGMNAVVSDWAEVGEWGMIAAGVPARLLDHAVDDEYRAAWRGFKQTYTDLCKRYREGARACPRPLRQRLLDVAVRSPREDGSRGGFDTVAAWRT